MNWIAENIGTIIICAILASVVTGIVFSLIKAKKNGKHSCGGNCGHCSGGCNHCH